MTTRIRLILIVLSAVVIAESGWLLWSHARVTWLAQESTPAERGHRVAERLGCFTCHGPGGTDGVANPGSPEGKVPGWGGGNYMMYITQPDDAREWVLYGKPKRQLGDAYYEERAAKALIQMPAYEGFLDDSELDDLIAYFDAVAWAKTPPPDARTGRSLARRHGCFACHGEEGRRRQPNPGSLKGYIPSWVGSDYEELVRDDDELREWIEDGTTQRLAEHPAARVFIERQRTQMPAYEDVLTAEEISRIMDYIHWLRESTASVDG